MKSNTRVNLAALATAGLYLLLAMGAQAAQPAKIDICHAPPDNPANTQLIQVGAKGGAADDHLSHGDWLSTAAMCDAIADNDCDGLPDDTALDDADCEAQLGVGSVCSSGECSIPTVTYSEYFEENVSYGSGTPQWDNWTTFTVGLDTAAQTYTTVEFSGSNDPVVFTCTNPTIVAQIAEALRLNSSVSATCDGHSWAVSPCGPGPSLGVDNPACDMCSDLNAIRPNLGSNNWGGLNSPSCASGPSQTLTLSLTRTP